MIDFVGQLLLAIGGLSGVSGFLFRLLSQQWNDRLKYVEVQFEECKALNKQQVEQNKELVILLGRQQVVTEKQGS